MSEHKKIYITKYALTQGILVYPGEIINHAPKDYAVVYMGPNKRTLFHGKDYHLSKKKAIARAEELKANKLTSLYKAARKLESMKFE